ncbi:MAG TPA: MCE family protein [Acidimicrobiia bacterium]|nr:MCE family protein [Acidimicrobiia bacterium]
MLIAAMVFFVWLTWAFFNKAFVNYDNVTLTGVKAGLSLPENADIKLRGMIVGEVRAVEVKGGEVSMTLGMKPELINEVPADVSAQIVPKTLFGEKYVSLIPTDPDSNAGPKLKAGDTIRGAVVPIEFEKLLNDIYPLLTAVEPENLATTLSALSSTLEGRGQDLGTTLVTLNNYLEKFNPESQAAVDDILKLGEVSDSYTGDLPTFGRLLRNSSFTSNTIVAKRTQLAAFFDESRRLSDVLTTLFRASGDDMVAVAAQSVTPLGVAEKYSSTFPCMFKAYDRLIDERLDSVFRGQTLHIDLKTIAPQPTKYIIGEGRGRGVSPEPPPLEGEHAVIPTHAAIDAEPGADPTEHGVRGDGGPEGLGTVCDDLDKFAAGQNPWSQDNPWPGPSRSVFKMVGLKNGHNGKFGPDSFYERAAVASLADAGYFEPSLLGVDSPRQRTELNRLAAVTSGVPASDVPDVASLLLSPVVRGAGVDAR